ncbi:MAG: alpha/beta fold hydrolase [Bacteroidota bacterium]
MLELNYKSFGQGEAVIILHGLFGTLDNWQSIAKKLAEEYYVFLIDQRNHGRSPHVVGLSYPLMANDLHDFMSQNWIHRAHVIGHSMGGKTAMQFALDYPDMLEKLVVVDIAPKAYEGGHELILNALEALQLIQIQNRKMAEKELFNLGIVDLGVRQFLLKNLTRNKTGGYRWKMNLAEISKHYQNILANIESQEQFDGATLFIRGEQSDYILDSDETILKQYFPHSKLSTVKDAGHWVHASQPVALLDLLFEFLDD